VGGEYANLFIAFVLEGRNRGGRLAGSAHDFHRMAAGITHPSPIPSPHDEFSQSAEESRPFSQETFFLAFGAAPVQPAIIRFKFLGGRFDRVLDFDLIFFQPSLHGIKVKDPLGEQFLRRASLQEPIIHIPGLDFQFFGDLIPGHFLNPFLRDKGYEISRPGAKYAKNFMNPPKKLSTPVEILAPQLLKI
jgi:hypothetical protein